jgi:cytochrome c
MNGTSDAIPNITGWPADDFVTAMHAYREKYRFHPVMQMISGRLSNDEIAALAAYYSSLKK